MHTGRTDKKNPSGKIQPYIATTVTDFFFTIYSFYRGGFGPYMPEILLQYLV